MNYLRTMSLTVMAVIGLQQTTLEALSPKKVVGLGCILASCTYWCVQQVYKYYNSNRKTIVKSHDVLSEKETPVETVNRGSEKTPAQNVKQETIVLAEKPMQVKKPFIIMDDKYDNIPSEDDLSHFNTLSSVATRKRAQEIKLGISHPYESF